MLRKPSISAWAVNQLARKERRQVRSLATSAERLRKAQAGLLRGGDAEELRASVERQRDVVGALVKRARELLNEAGHPITEATMERVRGTLTAVAGNEEGAKLVEQGRLEADLDLAGFGPMTAVQPTRKKGKGTNARQRRAGQKKVDELRAELREREEEPRRAAGELERAPSTPPRLREQRPRRKRPRSRSCQPASRRRRKRSSAPVLPSYLRSEIATCSSRVSASWRPASIPDSIWASRFSLLECCTTISRIVRPSTSSSVSVFTCSASGTPS